MSQRVQRRFPDRDVDRVVSDRVNEIEAVTDYLRVEVAQLTVELSSTFKEESV